ncbi:Pc12g13290 [Penicillium rubens Wisconsin 54-1255]|uniref:L-lactate dehydrogenase (cytochrome) n=1 Tax=Penicillium rubens (strain ATCC 28089 / DSM 1075 / NRRL 1951 / Wisconsin 54-1255) TaxID=500485 RepID=B6GZS8_PENRW|nr:Pc12g13290 [Penicillium rubens Wisconsin 54-1255]
MKLTRQEINQHNNQESCWVAIHGAVYDVTDFLDSHPGGAAVILRCAGKDATGDFDSVHSLELLSEALPESALQGHIDPAEFDTVKEKQDAMNEKKPNPADDGLPPLQTLINLHDFEHVAQKLPATTWAYYSSGADDEISKRNNALAYQKISLRPRILRKIPAVNTTAAILGYSTTLPVYISPVGLAKLAHPQGECALAAAAGKDRLVQVLANGSSMPIEQVMKSRTSPSQPIFQQLYVNKDIKKSVETVRRAERAGASAIWITVDSPMVGKREMDERLNLRVTVWTLPSRYHWAVIAFTNVFQATDNNTEGQGVAKIMASSISPFIDWEILTWLRQLTDLPVVIKGIQCVEDAVLAYQHGVQGIVLSNHGGRSQDTAQSPLLTLLEIRKFAPHLIESKMQIFIDGGIRRGTDVLKAIALGATAVGLGRPFLFSLSGYGEKGVRRMIEILRQEIETNMVFLGASSLEELRPEMVNTSRLEKHLIASVKL